MVEVLSYLLKSFLTLNLLVEIFNQLLELLLNLKILGHRYNRFIVVRRLLMTNIIFSLSSLLRVIISYLTSFCCSTIHHHVGKQMVFRNVVMRPQHGQLAGALSKFG